MSARGLFIVAGVVWCLRSLASFTDPAFTDPASAWDWFAVLSVSAALLALAVALVVFARQVGGRATVALSFVAATGATVAAVGNFLEDALQKPQAGDLLYFPGTLLLLLGLVALAVAVGLGERGWYRLLALVPACTLVGLVLLERGGGLLILAVWLIAALVAHANPRSHHREHRLRTA